LTCRIGPFPCQLWTAFFIFHFSYLDSDYQTSGLEKVYCKSKATHTGPTAMYYIHLTERLCEVKRYNVYTLLRILVTQFSATDTHCFLCCLGTNDSCKRKLEHVQTCLVTWVRLAQHTSDLLRPFWEISCHTLCIEKAVELILTGTLVPGCSARSRGWVSIGWRLGSGSPPRQRHSSEFPDCCGHLRKWATVCNTRKDTILCYKESTG
jgi:hypothetical protein